jgi:hypothetical protein
LHEYNAALAIKGLREAVLVETFKKNYALTDSYCSDFREAGSA